MHLKTLLVVLFCTFSIQFLNINVSGEENVAVQNKKHGPLDIEVTKKTNIHDGEVKLNTNNENVKKMAHKGEGTLKSRKRMNTNNHKNNRKVAKRKNQNRHMKSSKQGENFGYKKEPQETLSETNNKGKLVTGVFKNYNANSKKSMPLVFKSESNIDTEKSKMNKVVTKESSTEVIPALDVIATKESGTETATEIPKASIVNTVINEVILDIKNPNLTLLGKSNNSIIRKYQASLIENGYEANLITKFLMEKNIKDLQSYYLEKSLKNMDMEKNDYMKNIIYLLEEISKELPLINVNLPLYLSSLSKQSNFDFEKHMYDFFWQNINIMVADNNLTNSSEIKSDGVLQYPGKNLSVKKFVIIGNERFNDYFFNKNAGRKTNLSNTSCEQAKANATSILKKVGQLVPVKFLAKIKDKDFNINNYGHLLPFEVLCLANTTELADFISNLKENQLMSKK